MTDFQNALTDLKAAAKFGMETREHRIGYGLQPEIVLALIEVAEAAGAQQFAEWPDFAAVVGAMDRLAVVLQPFEARKP